jgi:hypothetical protein
MKTFNQLKESLVGKSAVFTFGRFNPPTQGHGLVFEKLLESSKLYEATPFIFTSSTQDNDKNPLSYQEKFKYLKLSFPTINKHLVEDQSINTPFDAIKYLWENNYTNLTLVVGSDRASDLDYNIQQYLNTSLNSKSQQITEVKVITAGKRDNSGDIAGISASGVRNAAKSGNYILFTRGLSKHLSERFSVELYQILRDRIL